MGKEKESPRKEFFYFSDDGLLKKGFRGTFSFESIDLA